MTRGGQRAAGRFLDPGLVVPVVLLVLVGIATVTSATVLCDGGGGWRLVIRHGVALILGLALAALLAGLPPRGLNDLSFLCYVAAIGLLLLTLIAGEVHGGARRWLELGALRLQPAEPAKLALILFLADFLARKRCDLARPSWLIGALLLVALPTALVLRQPDLGTALAFPAIGAVMLIWAGLPWMTLAVLVAPLISGLLAALQFLLREGGAGWGLLWVPFTAAGVMLLRRRQVAWVWVVLFAALQIGVAVETPRLWNSLAPYQQARVQTYLHPERDPTGAGYQVIQSQIAIGSGCWDGRGYGRGSQKALSFLPRQHTDFIYSVIGEEWGFLGALAVLLLYGTLLLRGLAVARAIRARFTSLVAIGVIALIFYHSAINIAMTLGLAPVTGLPLPFVSFGGSFLVASLAAVGLLLGAAARRNEY